MTISLDSYLKSGGGAVGFPINGVTPIYTGDDIHRVSDKSEWLKSGVSLHGPALSDYPDATQSYTEITDFTFFASEVLAPRGITFDGAHLWVISESRTVYKYTKEGVYTNVSISLSGLSVPSGMCWDGSSFWVASRGTGTVHRFDSSWNSTPDQFDVSPQDSNPQGITFDGVNLWVAGDTSNKLYEYSVAGVYTGEFIDTASDTTSLSGLAYDGDRLILMSDRKVMFYNKDKTNEYSFVPGTSSGDVFFGVAVMDGLLYALNTTDKKISTYYYREISIPASVYNSIPNYLRIK